MVPAGGGRELERVDWPAELRGFKTADTTHYVRATVTSARVCATCSRPFVGGDHRSLTVEVTVPGPHPPGPGLPCYQFAGEVHHGSCRPPALQVVSATTDPVSHDVVAAESDMHYVLMTDTGDGTAGLPSLVFTTAHPIVLRDVELAEGRSAWVSTYLGLGFDLVGVEDLRWVRANATTRSAVHGTLDGALFSLTGTVDGQELPLLQWTRRADHPAYRSWCRAVIAARALFVLYGEYVGVDTDAGTVDLAPGGRLGDIAAAVVRVDVVPAVAVAGHRRPAGW